MAKTRRRGFDAKKAKPHPKYGKRGNARHHYANTKEAGCTNRSHV